MMKVIRMVSSIHILWGSSLMFLPVPRPFGALEPYFVLFSTSGAGAVLTFSGALPLLALHLKRFRCLLCSVVPQQMLLFWALIISGRDVIETHDHRAVLALCYLLPMTIYHFSEVVDLAEHFFWKARKDDRD